MTYARLRTITTFLILLFTAYNLMAQSNIPDWENAYQSIEDDDIDESADAASSYEELTELAEHKIDLNAATREELLQLPFLSENQVMDIMEYIYRYGPMKSASELLMVKSLDDVTIRLIGLCTYLGEGKQKDIFPSTATIGKYGKHEFMATANIPLYERKGDNDGYLGYNIKHWARYQFSYGKYIKAGIIGSQDAGEPFFAGNNKWGYDYVSPYIILRHMGCAKALAIGRYKARFGMGIVMNNGFSLGKLGSVASAGRVARGLYAHSSRQEGGYMQGIATTIEAMRGLDITAIASYRKIDATLNNDDNSIATILKTGYHRSATEMIRRRNASQTVAGGNINYHAGRFHVGATGYYTAFDKPLHPDTSKVYKLIAPWGKGFWNIGADYGYTSSKLSVSGEVATGGSKGIATINSISLSPTNQLTAIAIQRFYSYRYYSLMASSFAEGRTVQNESGIYIGLKYMPTRQLVAESYADWAYFPFPKYLATGSSRTFDTQHSITLTKKAWQLSARYRLKTWNKDNSQTGCLDRATQHRIRIYATRDGKTMLLRSQADISIYRMRQTSYGYMLSQQAGIRGKGWQAYAVIAYFHTDDYNSRVYSYERSTLYTLSFPMLYGCGFRMAMTARADISPRLMAMAKVACTHHTDKNTIGSGMQTIYGHTTTDMALQIKWRF